MPDGAWQKQRSLAGRLRRAVGELDTLIAPTGRIVEQIRGRLAGDLPESGRWLVSLHDGDARPIARGRINKPVEFGYKAQVVENEDGIIVDYAVGEGQST